MPLSCQWSAVWLHLGVNPLKLRSSHSCSTLFVLFLPSFACFWVHLIHFENFAIWNVSKQNCYTIVGKQNNISSYLVLMWCKVSSIISWFSDGILIHAAVVTKRSIFQMFCWKPYCCPEFLFLKLGISDLHHRPGFEQGFWIWTQNWPAQWLIGA